MALSVDRPGDKVQPIAAVDPKAKQKRAALLILYAACERALEALQAADNPLDTTFVADVERIIARTKAELEALAAAAGETT